MDEVPAFLHSATVFDHIALAVAWRRITPIGKGSNRHTLPDRRARAPAAPPRMSGCFAFRAQQSIDGGGAHAKHSGSYHRVEFEMTVALHGIDQDRDKRPEPLAADPIARLPQHREGLTYRLILKSPAWTRALRRPRLIQHTQRVFAMIPGYAYELGQDLSSLPPPCGRLIPFSNRIFQLSACRHAQLPRHLLHHPAAPLLGSSLREATAIAPVTKIVSQCDRQK